MEDQDIMQWGKRYHFDNVYEPYLPFTMVQLRQAGEIIAGDGYVIPEHMQPCSEISYVVSGQCDFYVDDQVIHAKEGDIHVVGPGKKHMIVSGNNDNLRMAYIGFCFYERDEDADWSQLKNFYLNAVLELRNDRLFVKTFFEQLLTEIYLSQTYRKEVIDACITQILVQVYRIFENEDTKSEQYNVDESRMNHIVGHTVFRALRYIDNNISQIDNLSQVARELGYNPTYLSRIFSEKTGKTMSDYIIDKKVETAKALLEKGTSVSEVAYSLGYSSSQSFCKMFRRCTDCAPKTYRKEHMDKLSRDSQ